MMGKAIIGNVEGHQKISWTSKNFLHGYLAVMCRVFRNVEGYTSNMEEYFAVMLRDLLQ